MACGEAAAMRASSGSVCSTNTNPSRACTSSGIAFTWLRRCRARMPSRCASVEAIVIVVMVGLDDPPPVGTSLDELCQPHRAGLGPLRAGHVMQQCPAITRRRGFPVFPRGLVAPELALVVGRQHRDGLALV